MTSPSPSCQCLVAGEGDAAGPGGVRTKHFRDTEGQAPTWSRTSPAGRLASSRQSRSGSSAAGHAIHAVSYARGQDQDQRQDATSLCEGRCGSPEDNPVNNQPVNPRPTI